MFQYILFGFVVIDLLMSCGIAGVALQYLDRQDTWAIFFLCMAFFPVCPVPWIVEKLVISSNPDARRMYYEFRSKQAEPEVDRIDTLLINTGNETTRIVGVETSKWVQWARIIKRNNYRCTARVMGSEYDAFRAAIEPTRYAEDKNGLQLTGDGRRMIDSLLHSPNKINAQKAVFNG